MPLIRTQKLNDSKDNEWEMDEFETSVKMSSYLVAFVVSNFESISQNSTKYNIRVEVSGRKEQIRNGDGKFALDEASRILDFYTDLYDVKYPLKKSTQIAIPDFNAGAMENWGLVTYREKYLLFNPNVDSIFNKKRITVVVAHELAHQWVKAKF